MMSSIEIEKHQLPSTLESLAKIEQIIEDIKEKHQIPEELYGNILVATTEAVNNALKHGNKLDISKDVQLHFEFSDSEFNVQIKDQGKGFDYTSVPDPTHPDNIEKPDGRGIFIMKNLCDEVVFEEEGRLVTLKFAR